MLTYTKYPEHDFTLFVSKGDTTIDEWLDTVKQYGAEGMTRYEIYDLRYQTYAFSTDEIDQILSKTIRDKQLRPPEAKTAVIVDEELGYGLVRMYEIQAEISEVESDTHVYYDINAAIEWLGLDLKGVVFS